jgi:hypothetical protein
MAKLHVASDQEKCHETDLLEIAISGAGLHAAPGLSFVAGARVVIRGIADQIQVLTSIGSDNLDGNIANGFAHALLQVDRELERAMEWPKRAGVNPSTPATPRRAGAH